MVWGYQKAEIIEIRAQNVGIRMFYSLSLIYVNERVVRNGGFVDGQMDIWIQVVFQSYKTHIFEFLERC